jgi:hypothetical protein
MLKIIESKNCRKYLKRCYELPLEVDAQLIAYLDEFGCAEIIDFKSFSPQSKNIFRIHIEEFYMISGVIEEKILQLTVPPEQQFFIAEFEKKLIAFLQK